MLVFTTVSFLAFPKEPEWVNVIWLCVTYICWSMSYTVSDIPFWGITAAISPLPEERSKFLNLARVLCSIGAMVSMVLAPITIKAFGGDYEVKAYTLSALLYGGLGAAMFITFGTLCRDKVPAPKENKSFKENLVLLKKNKPLGMIFLSGVLSCCRSLAQSAAAYIALYNYQGGITVFGFFVDGLRVQTVVAAGFGVGLFVGMMLVPLLQKKFDLKSMFIWSSAFAFLVQFAMFFVPFRQVSVVMILLLFAGIPFGFYNVLTYAMISDCVQYYEWKTGERTEDFSFSMQTFMTKLGGGIAVAVTGLVLIIGKFQQPATEEEILKKGIQNAVYQIKTSPKKADTMVFVQSEFTLQWIYALITIIPAISCLLSIFPILKYELDGKKMKEVNEDLAARRAAQAQQAQIAETAEAVECAN